jgi:hypothetical protein
MANTAAPVSWAAQAAQNAAKRLSGAFSSPSPVSNAADERSAKAFQKLLATCGSGSETRASASVSSEDEYSTSYVMQKSRGRKARDNCGFATEVPEFHNQNE